MTVHDSDSHIIQFRNNESVLVGTSFWYIYINVCYVMNRFEFGSEWIRPLLEFAVFSNCFGMEGYLHEYTV